MEIRPYGIYVLQCRTPHGHGLYPAPVDLWPLEEIADEQKRKALQNQQRRSEQQTLCLKREKWKTDAKYMKLASILIETGRFEVVLGRSRLDSWGRCVSRKLIREPQREEERREWQDSRKAMTLASPRPGHL